MYTLLLITDFDVLLLIITDFDDFFYVWYMENKVWYLILDTNSSFTWTISELNLVKVIMHHIKNFTGTSLQNIQICGELLLFVYLDRSMGGDHMLVHEQLMNLVTLDSSIFLESIWLAKVSFGVSDYCQWGHWCFWRGDGEIHVCGPSKHFTK